jgi:hypothetical protein
MSRRKKWCDDGKLGKSLLSSTIVGHCTSTPSIPNSVEGSADMQERVDGIRRMRDRFIDGK